MSESILLNKSKAFAIRIINMYKHLTTTYKEFVLTKQVLRSGTSTGANVKEALQGQSKADFVSKLSISLKEASETEYWLELLNKTNFITDKEFRSIHKDCEELIKLLTSIIKTSKNK